MSASKEIIDLLLERKTSQPHESLHRFSLRKSLIPFAAFENSLKEIALLHYRWRSAGVTEGLLMYGQHGSGKSTVIEHYLKLFPRRRQGGVMHIPVLRALTPETPSVVSLSDVLLASLDPALPTRGSASVKLNKI